MAETTLWRLINNWLASRNESDVYIAEDNDHFALMSCHSRRDSHIGAIGDTFVVLSPDIVLEAADPDFFIKLDKAIIEAKKS
jgi:hypothetical protein